MRITVAIALAVALAIGSLAADKVYIAVRVEPPGAGTVDGDGLYAVGETVRLSAEPYPGYEFLAWEEGGVVIAETATLEFVAAEDRELLARFAPQEPPELRGMWIGKLALLPVPGFNTSRLELQVRKPLLSSPLMIVAALGFSGNGWTDLGFRGSWRLGSVSLGGGVAFDPGDTAYRTSYLSLSGAVGDLRWNLRARHAASGGVPPGPHLTLSLSLSLRPLSLALRGEEGNSGFSFHDILLRLSPLPIPEGIGCPEARASLAFTKGEGFSYVNLELPRLLQLCCGIEFDARVKFTPAYKELSFTPHWQGIKGCLSVYGVVDWDGEAFRIEGLELYGYKIRCCFDCGSCPGSLVSGPYAEYAIAFQPGRMPGGFQPGEFEYWRFGVCGPACCSGYWTLEGAVYFSRAEGPWGISRVGLISSLPLTLGLEIRASFQLAVLLAEPRLELGWRLII